MSNAHKAKESKEQTESIRAKILKHRQQERETQLKSDQFEPSSKHPSTLDFLYQPPPGLFDKVEPEPKPEDSIPNTPENAAVREYLKKAPINGQPLGKEVKLMQCYRCKSYGHRSGDKECPLRLSGDQKIEAVNKMRADPMSSFVSKKQQDSKQADKAAKKSNSSDSSDDDKKHKKHKKHKKKHKKHKKHKRGHSDTSDSESPHDAKRKKLA